MTLARWKTIESLFYEALAKQGEARRQFLETVRLRDEALYREVNSLLLHHTPNPNDPLLQDAVSALALLAEPPVWDKHSQIGSYDIIRLVGKGGMGEVYLARDRRLGRKVALKTLPQSLTEDSSQIARLRREALAASALNHPNILTIFEFGQHDDIHYIVSEFVEGVSLRERIGHISAAEAIGYARQIGRALEALHALNIVHRDIKPENIMVRADGYIKVLDFGLAKLAAPQLEHVGSMAHPAQGASATSSAGLIMGTINYMSPEQVRGTPVDLRTDIWSWGVVLYEMVAGRPPFDAPTTGDVLAAILDKEPGPGSADHGLNRILTKSLAKKVDDRYQTMTEALRDLEAVSASPAAHTSADELSQSPKKIRLRWRTGDARPKGKILAAALSVLVLAGLAGLLVYRIPDSHFRVQTMTRLTVSGNVTRNAISPDGNYVAYATAESEGQTIHIRQLRTNADTEIVPSAVVRFTGITFSNDNQFVYYVAEKNQPGGPLGTLYRIPVIGGLSRKVLEDVDSPISFSPDGKRFAFLRNDAAQHRFALLIRSLSGGPETHLADLAAPQTLGPAPIWSPDGESILCGIYTAFTPGAANIKILAVRVQDGHQRLIGPLPWYWMGKPIWIDNGRRVAIAANHIYSNRSQLVELSWPAGTVSAITHDTQSYGDLDASSDVREVVAVQSDRLAAIWIAAEGQLPRRITQIGSRFYGVTWTNSGELVSQTDIGGHPDLWSVDASSGQLRQLTDDEYVEDLPTSSPDGRYLVYGSNRGGAFHIWRANQDGGDPLRLTSDSAHEQSPDVTPDGQWVVYTSTRSGYLSLWKVPIQGGTPSQITSQGSKEPAVSPDGSRVACSYLDSEVGWTTAVLRLSNGERLRSFDYLGAEAAVRWSANGRDLLYVKTEAGVSNIWAQPEKGGPARQLTHFAEERIFSFAVSPDGKSLACIRGSKTSDVVLVELAK